MPKTHVREGIITFGIAAYWFLFWLLNVADKLIGQETFLFAGKDRLAQFADYFSSIGLEASAYAYTSLSIITGLEILALIFAALAVFSLVFQKKKEAETYFFYTCLVGLTVFSFFSIGDQIFGDRFELLEHTIYWTSIIISWAAYKYFPKK